jgi:hypothetical protein
MRSVRKSDGLLRLFARRWPIWALALCTGSMVMSSVADPLTLDDQKALAMRFRPFIKTTLDEGRDEPFHLVSWQWFIARSDLEPKSPWLPTVATGAQMDADHLQLVLPSSNANISLAGAFDPQLYLNLQDSAYRSGEDWSQAIHNGDGIYAHVEVVNENTVNIEYTLLWAYNWALGSQHDGDITTITVDYDRPTDLISRITYSMHGCVLEAFRVAQPASISFRKLHGVDESGVADVVVTQLNVSEKNSSQFATDCAPPWCPNGDCHSPSDRYIYLVRDPVSRRFEHPVIYAEEGSHEPWPNQTGSIWSAPAHDGTGMSFLPDTLEILGTLDAPNLVDYPFIFYNGHFGSDPQAIMLHRSWYWPEGRTKRDGTPANRYHIPESRFADLDPYDPNAGLGWPPPSELASPPPTVFVGHVTVYVTYVSGTSFDGSPAAPFPDPETADSFAAAGATISMASGSYPGGVTLSRKAVFVAANGPVTIGRP